MDSAQHAPQDGLGEPDNEDTDDGTGGWSIGEEDAIVLLDTFKQRLGEFSTLAWERKAGALAKVSNQDWQLLDLGFNEVFGRHVLGLDAVKLLAKR